MPYTREELIDSITKLRQRREAIPELRDYRPQASKSRAAGKAKAKDPTQAFAKLFGRKEGGEDDGTR